MIRGKRGGGGGGEGQKELRRRGEEENKPLANCTNAILTGFFRSPAIVAIFLFPKYVVRYIELLVNKLLTVRSVLNMLLLCSSSFLAR
jgi:hypothetical protein